MGLYKLFSSSVEIQYKSCLFSAATFFTLVTTLLNILLPFIIAYRSRGFWLKSHQFYEQPVIRFQYQYLLVATTDDPSSPISCGDLPLLRISSNDEHCSQFQVIELDKNGDGINDVLDFKLQLNLAPKRTVLSITLLLLLDFQFKSTCPLQMQSLAIIDKEFSFPSSGLTYNADINFYQTAPLPCYRHHLDVKYNHSLFEREEWEGNLLDSIILAYFSREATTRLINVYSRSQHGLLSTFDLSAHIRIPEQAVRYKPSFFQELKWAWPQYLSLVIIFYWIFNKIKGYVFNNHLIMAWEVVPWKKHKYSI